MAKRTPPTITPELKNAVETFLLAKAYTETIRPIVREYQRQLLAEMQLPISEEWTQRRGEEFPEGTLILEPQQTWMLGDEDARAYYDRLHPLHLAHGFDVKPDYCPLLMAEADQSDAERLVLNAAQYITGLEPHEFMHPANGRTGMENYHHATELVVGLVLSLCPDINADSLMRGMNG